MTLVQLRYFLAVLEAKSFTRAADIIHVAQPAIGMQVRQLEDALGVRLLIRHLRGVVPTEAGKRLARHARGFSGRPNGYAGTSWRWAGRRAAGSPWA